MGELNESADQAPWLDPEHAVRDLVLVAAQGVLFLAVVAAAFAPWGPQLWSSVVVALAVIAIGVTGVGLAAAGLGKALTPMPTPNGEGLAAAGVYRFARHPMYSALVVVCLGVAVGAGTVACYAVVAVLAAFFAVKARVEERGLVATYPGYAEYAARVGRFLPGVGRLRARP